MAIELTPQQKDILIRTALGEARGEGVEGMADVIQVILNRAQSGQYPSDPAAVALQPYQFSTWNRGEGGNNPQQFKPSDPIYRKAAEALEKVASGERPDYTGGALFYHTPAVNPNWAGEVNKFGTIQRNGHIFYPSRPVPPGEIPNVVASKLDTTPQTRNVPRPQPRPAQRMVQGTGQAPTSAASRAFPTQNVTPRLAPQGDGIFAYTPPDMQPAQITPGMGSLTPDFFRPQPQVRLPTLPPSNLASSRVVNASIERANAAVDPGLQAALARRVAQPGMVETSMARAANAVDPALQRALEARNAVGVGLPPATRSVPSIPVRPAMNAIGTMPSFGQFQAQFGRPAVATQMATARPVIGFPTPAAQRPVQRTIGFPTPANMRPAMAQPQRTPLQVTVQGANSYSAPQPQYVSTTGQALQPRQTVRYNPDTNTFVPVTLYEPTQRQERRSSISGPAQSLV